LQACWLDCTGCYSGNAGGWLLMRDLALWGFLLPVFLTVCHRMLPFFTVSAMPEIPAWKPDWLLWALLAGSWLHGLLSMLGVTTLPADLPFCLLLAYTSWRWQGWRTLQVKLLGMLHLSFAWLPLAFLLFSLADVLPANTLGLAPLHAVTTGFFISMVIAFVSRVSLGHAGQPCKPPPGCGVCIWPYMAWPCCGWPPTACQRAGPPACMH
jgi:uncharacterized protein involved in response to NO